jgi:hypothetical protein
MTIREIRHEAPGGHKLHGALVGNAEREYNATISASSAGDRSDQARRLLTAAHVRLSGALQQYRSGQIGDAEIAAATKDCAEWREIWGTR